MRYGMPIHDQFEAHFLNLWSRAQTSIGASIDQHHCWLVCVMQFSASQLSRDFQLGSCLASFLAMEVLEFSFASRKLSQT